MERWEKALMCNTCSFPWCKYSHHGWFQTTHMISQNTVTGFPKVIATAVRADGAVLHTTDSRHFQDLSSSWCYFCEVRRADTILIFIDDNSYVSHIGGWLNSIFIWGMYVTDHMSLFKWNVSTLFYTTLKNPHPWRNREGSRKWREENVRGKLWLTALQKRCGAGSVAWFTSGFKRRTSLRPALGNSCRGYSCCGRGNRLLLLFKSRSHVWLCDPMDCSTPGFPVRHFLPEFAQTHIHWVGDAIQPSHPLSSPSPLALNLSQHQGLFQWVSSSHQVAKVLELQLQHQSFQWIFRVDFL